MKNSLRNYSHVLWALYVPVHLIIFFAIEKLIVTDYIVSWCPLDNYIPFIKEFVLAYVSWFPLLIGVGLWLIFKDPPGFRRYIWSLAFGFGVSLIICVVFPNGQDMRPANLGSDIFSRLIALLYSADTNTNVFPSMHVVGTMAVLFAVFRTKTIKHTYIKVLLTILGILINASTVFIKQHSVVDIAGGLVLSVIMYIAVYIIIERLIKKYKLKKHRRFRGAHAANKIQSFFPAACTSDKNTLRVVSVELSAYGGQPRRRAQRNSLKKMAEPFF